MEFYLLLIPLYHLYVIYYLMDIIMKKNKRVTTLVQYPLLEKQKIMLENLIPMFKSNDLETISFVRDIVLNTPLLNIIVGIPTDIDGQRTLHDRVAHCKPKHHIYFSLKDLYVTRIYYRLGDAIETTINNGYYYMYG